MNHAEMRLWKEGVEECNSILENLINDRKKLKEVMRDHLKTFFDEWYDIRFSDNLEEIVIKFKQDFVLDNTALSDIGMDWVVVPSYTDNGHLTKSLKVYPFGRGE